MNQFGLLLQFFLSGEELSPLGGKLVGKALELLGFVVEFDCL